MVDLLSKSWWLKPILGTFFFSIIITLVVVFKGQDLWKFRQYLFPNRMYSDNPANQLCAALANIQMQVVTVPEVRTPHPPVLRLCNNYS